LLARFERSGDAVEAVPMCTLAQAFRRKMTRPRAVEANLLLLHKRIALRDWLWEKVFTGCQIVRSGTIDARGNRYSINSRARLDSCLNVTRVRCSRSRKVREFRKFPHFFIRVFFRFSKAFVPFSSRCRTKFQRSFILIFVHQYLPRRRIIIMRHWQIINKFRSCCWTRRSINADWSQPT